MPKKLSKKIKPNADNGHVHFSNPKRAFEHLRNSYELTPEFRIIGDFPVNTHIISSLWINMVGHKYDAKLTDDCYGARLRRLGKDDIEEQKIKPYHIEATGSFQPYFYPYQNWRNDGLKTMRRELENGENIIAVSLDLKSYYHYLDPTAISSSSLIKLMGLDDELSPAEKKLHITVFIFFKIMVR